MMSSDEFAKMIKGSDTSESAFRMAKVTAVTSGSPRLTFYGENNQRTKVYKRLASYSPTVNDIVICAKINGSYLILGKVV